MDPADDQRATLLLNELCLANTFLAVARTAPTAEVRELNIRNAGRAYITAVTMLAEGVKCSEAVWLRIEELTSDYRLGLTRCWKAPE